MVGLHIRNEVIGILEEVSWRGSKLIANYDRNTWAGATFRAANQ
jgi:hypothetical protein